MKKLTLTTTLFSLFFLGIISVNAQTTISGVITDADGLGLIGANVIVEGSSVGTITDFDGAYSLTTSADPPFNVVVSYTGYSSQVLPITSNNQNVSVTLAEGIVFGEDIVVSASRRREKVQEAPASVSILTSRKLEISPNDSPVRAIINEPGVYIQQQGAGRVNIQLRGDGGIFGSASFPILDYRSLSGPGLGTFDNLNSPLNNIDIERIEVVRGPGSALYGPGVTSGVVHFLSKSPIDKPGTTLELIGGELNTFGGAIRHATKVSDKFGFKINGVWKRGGEFTYDPSNPIDAEQLGFIQNPLSIVSPGISPDGFVDATLPTTTLLTNEQLDPDGDGNPIQDFWRQWVVNGTLEFRPQDDLSVAISGGANNASALFYNSQGVGLSQAVETWAQARVQKGGLFAQAFWLANNGGAPDSPTFLYNTGSTTRVQRTQLEGQLQYNFDTPGLLDANWTAGFDYRLSVANTFNQVYGRNENDDDFGIIGGYVQGKFALGKKLDLVLAGRADRFTFLDETGFSPRAVLVYKPSPKHTFRGGFNRAIAAPSQLIVNIDFPVSTVIPGSFDIWLNGNVREQTFDNPTLQWFTGAIPETPFGTINGLPLGVILGAEAAPGVSLNQAVIGGIVAQLGLDPTLAQSIPIVQGVLSQLEDPATLASLGVGGQLSPGFNVFNGQPLGLINAPSSALRTEDTWEVGYKGLLFDKLGVSVDVYNRSIDNATLFTGISPSFVLIGADGAPGLGGIDGQLGAAVQGFAQPQIEAAFLAAGVDAATAAAGAALLGGAINGAYTGGANTAINTPSPAFGGASLGQVFAALPFHATVPTDQVPQNGVTHVAAGYRTFEEFSYTGVDVGLNYFFTDDFSAFANYTWTSENEFEPQIVGAAEGVTELTSISQPTNRWRIGANYTPACGINANISFQHDDEFQAFLGQFEGLTDEKNLVDASVGYKFNNGLFLGVSGQNIFDNEYRTFPGFPQIGRRILGTARYTFGAGEDANPCAGSGLSSNTGSSKGLLSTVDPKKIDSDGDGVKDIKDLCPDIPGIKKFGGCPRDKAIMDREAQEAKMAAEKAAEEAEAKRKMEEEAARVKAEAERKKRAEEAKMKAEKEAAMKAEEEAKMAAEKAAAMKAEEAAKAAAARTAEIETNTRAVFSRALTGIKFNSSQSTFKNESYTIMDEVVSVMAQYPEIDVRVAGHTDSQGAEENNQRLSETRARAVMDYLISKGVSPQRLSAVGFGEVAPISDNNTAAGRAENRRVEFSIKKN